MTLSAEGPRSEYREFASPAALADCCLCFWTQTVVGSQGDYEQRVLPDACVDIVLIDHNPPMLIGPWDIPFVAHLAVGTTIVGARLHPGRSSSLLGVPASELLNQSVPIADVKGPMQTMRLEETQSSAAARQSALAQALAVSLKSSASPDQAVLAGIRWLSRHPHGRIAQLSRWIGIGERQLHRRFAAAVGYGPKMFQSVLRFQRLLKAAREKQAEQNLADLAAATGYADQAHMTREVQRLANLRPTVLFRSAGSTLEMSDLFKT
jgi:AraC-like DNA-binding protein